MKHEKRMAPTLLSDVYSMLVIAVPQLVSVAYRGMHICATNLAVHCSSGTSVKAWSVKYLSYSRWG